MINFTSHRSGKIFFGRGMETAFFEDIAKSSPGKVLLHYGQKSILTSGLHEKVCTELAQRGIEFVELGGVTPNPKLDLVRTGAMLCKEQGVGLVLAVGGGSVIDSAKAIAAGACYSGDPLELIAGRAPITQALPIAAVLTVAGAGSESSPAAVITDQERNIKLDFGAECLIPRSCLLNPENTFGVSLYQTRSGIVDAMTHVLERYFSNTEFVDCSDRLCEGLIQTLMHYATQIGNRLDDYDSRAEIMWACKLAHDDLAGLGRRQDWTSHTIAHALGGRFGTTHGILVCTVMIAWMKAVSQRNPQKLVQFAHRIFGIDPLAKDAAESGIVRFEQFIASLPMPTRLSGLEIPEDHAAFDEIAEYCSRKNPSGTIGNYVRLSRDDIANLLTVAY